MQGTNDRRQTNSLTRLTPTCIRPNHTCARGSSLLIMIDQWHQWTRLQLAQAPEKDQLLHVLSILAQQTIAELLRLLMRMPLTPTRTWGELPCGLLSPARDKGSTVKEFSHSIEFMENTNDRPAHKFPHRRTMIPVKTSASLDSFHVWNIHDHRSA